MDNRIRVFVGCTDSEWIPYLTLKHSIEKRSSQPVEVIPLMNFMRMLPNDLKGPIPFSFQRFLIPELCNFTGHAIYLDSDMLVLGDIAELWAMKDLGYDLVAPGVDVGPKLVTYSVMVIDCLRCDWTISELAQAYFEKHLTYADLLHNMKIVDNKLTGNAPEWARLEHDGHAGETKLVHYTDFTKQPWKINRPDRGGQLWYEEFAAARKSGYFPAHVLQDYLRERGQQ